MISELPLQVLEPGAPARLNGPPNDLHDHGNIPTGKVVQPLRTTQSTSDIPNSPPKTPLPLRSFSLNNSKTNSPYLSKPIDLPPSPFEGPEARFRSRTSSVISRPSSVLSFGSIDESSAAVPIPTPKKTTLRFGTIDEASPPKPSPIRSGMLLSFGSIDDAPDATLPPNDAVQPSPGSEANGPPVGTSSPEENPYSTTVSPLPAPTARRPASLDLRTLLQLNSASSTPSSSNSSSPSVPSFTNRSSPFTPGAASTNELFPSVRPRRGFSALSPPRQQPLYSPSGGKARSPGTSPQLSDSGAAENAEGSATQSPPVGTPVKKPLSLDDAPTSTPNKPHPYLKGPLLYISRLPIRLTKESLETAFTALLPVKFDLVRDPGGKTQSGTIEFSSLDHAEKALATVRALNLRTTLELHLSPVPPSAQQPSIPPITHECRVLGLPAGYTDIQLYSLFRRFGPISSASVGLNVGRLKGAIRFWNLEDAEAAQRGLHRTHIGKCKLLVDRDSSPTQKVAHRHMRRGTAGSSDSHEETWRRPNPPQPSLPPAESNRLYGRAIADLGRLPRSMSNSSSSSGSPNNSRTNTRTRIGTFADAVKRDVSNQVTMRLIGPSTHSDDGAFVEEPMAGSWGSIFETLELKENDTPIANLSGQVTRMGKEPVAHGGFCDVWLGEWKGGEKVAMRMLRLIDAPGKVKKQFRREALLWCELSHPNVLPLYGITELGVHFYMISPWLENGDCISYLEKNPDANRRRILKQIAEALEYLHCGAEVSPVIHGDVKGQNVLMDAAGNALLADFGLAKLMEDCNKYSATPTNLRGAGSYRYMAPELLQPNAEEDSSLNNPKRDVYAFGMTLLELMTLERPFAHIKTDARVIAFILASGKPDRPEIFDDDLWEICNDCWTTKPEARPDMSSIVRRFAETL